MMTKEIKSTRCPELLDRKGLSIIEVLISIVVAMIGVFGIMILIPFAIKQAKSGLDRDAAVVSARNAYSMFEIAGHRNPESWAVSRGGAVVTAYSPYEAADVTGDGVADDVNGDGDITNLPFPTGDADAPSIFSIDPLAVTINGHAAAAFPFNRRNAGSTAVTAYPDGTGWVDLTIPAANLGQINGLPMGLASADRMFRSSDVLIYEEAANELLGPEQVFDVSQNPGGGLFNARRQSDDKISWSAIVVPFKDDPTMQGTTRWSYKIYLLVYKDRVIELANSTPSDQMACAQVNPATTGASGSNSPVTVVDLATDVELVSEVVNRDDWVMLINQGRRPSDTPAGLAETGFHRQLAFYRVVNVNDRLGGVPASLTLDGPDFQFDDGAGALSATYMVHLKNVVGVYERTFEPEFASSWSIID